MSKTELYIVKKDGELELYKEFGNSHRGASILWSNLSKKYLNVSWITLANKEMKKLWNLDRDSNVPRALRILLISTFDHFLIKKENLPQFIDACEEVYKKNYFDDLGHFEDYPEVMREIMELDDVIAITWNQTSVCCDTWYAYDVCKHCDNGTIQRDYNIFVDKNHEFLFEYLKEIEKGVEIKYE